MDAISEKAARYLAELIGPADEYSLMKIADEHLHTEYRTAVMFDHDEDDPTFYLVTLGLGRSAPAGERFELGIHVMGEPVEFLIHRLSLALSSLAARIARGLVEARPGLIVDLPEIEFAFPGRNRALLTDFVYTVPDWLPVGDDQARVLFLRPIFLEEEAWLTSTPHEQVGKIFRKAGVRIEDPRRRALVSAPELPILARKEASTGLGEGTMDDKEIVQLFKKLEAWFAKNAPAMVETLDPPATAEDLAELEKSLGRSLPGDLRAVLAYHDGGLNCNSYGLISASRIGYRHESESKNAGKETSSKTDDKVKSVVWSKDWIVFAEDGGLNYLCLDFDPGPKGKAGQVIRWERKLQCAAATGFASFGDWFKNYAETVLSGKAKVDKSGTVFFV